VFAVLAGRLVAAAWRRSARGMHRLAAASAARWGGLAVASAYALLAGWGVPSQRTVWMLATVTLLQSAGLRWPWPLVLLAAAGVVSAFDPWALLQPGFWLSFMAVGLLMASSPADGRPPSVDAAGPASVGSLGSAPGAVWTVAAAPTWAQLAGLLGAALLVLPLPWRIRALAPLLALPLMLPPQTLPADGTFDVTALDVGQGTAVVVRT